MGLRPTVTHCHLTYVQEGRKWWAGEGCHLPSIILRLDRIFNGTSVGAAEILKTPYKEFATRAPVSWSV